jgi:hypothetical protein
LENNFLEGDKMVNEITTKKEKMWIHLIFLTISILCSIFFSSPANAATGDLILDTRILFPYPDPHEAITLGTTLLKEGYSISMDDVYDICCRDKTAVGLTIYKNDEIVKRIKVKTGDYIYYNKTINGREYTIIESKFDVHFLGTPNNMVMLRPFFQYSDGSIIIEPDFVYTNLNPKTTQTPYEEWNRRFGGIYDDNVWSLQRTSDDGYIIGGTIKSQNPEGSPMYVDIPLLIKVDGNGNEIWKKTFGDFGNTSSVLDLPDGGNIFVAIKSFEMTSQKTFDGGFIIAGKYRIVKTDSKGKEQWSKTIRLFGKEGVFTTSSVKETQDGGYILTGEEACISKIDSNGTEQWSRTFGAAGYDSLNSVQNTLDGGYIFAGRTARYGAGSDAWLLKTDANGNEEWNKTFGLEGFDSVNSVVQTPDGGYVLAGIIDTAKNPDHKGQILYEDHDAWLFKTDATGNIEWSKTIGGLKRDEAKFVQQAPDGGYVIAGTTESYGSVGSDIWLVKVSGDPEGIENISVASQTETRAASRTRTMTAVPTETSRIIPSEKTGGFEGFLAITVLLLTISLLRNRR